MTRATDDCIVVTFDVPSRLTEQYRWTQGQHVTVRKTLDGDELRRSYSICTPPDSGELTIAIKKDPRGRFSRWANKSLRAGDTLDVLTPTGGFHTDLEASQRKTYVAFAAGSGITPVISNLKTILQTEPGSRCVLFYASRKRASIIFHDELHDLKNRYLDRFAMHFFLTGDDIDSSLYAGRIDADKVRELSRVLAPPATVDEYFVCGPGTMIDEVCTTLRELGADPDHVHFERFASSASPARKPGRAGETASAGAEAGTQVTVVLDGVTRQFAMPRDGSKVLDAALDAGIELPYSCMGGVCSTCRSKLREGRVEMDVNYALEDWEVEEGFVLTCQSRPLDDRLVLDFDEV